MQQCIKCSSMNILYDVNEITHSHQQLTGQSSFSGSIKEKKNNMFENLNLNGLFAILPGHLYTLLNADVSRPVTSQVSLIFVKRTATSVCQWHFDIHPYHCTLTSSVCHPYHCTLTSTVFPVRHYLSCLSTV